MTILENISLKEYNTFGVECYAKRFVSIDSFYELQELIKTEKDIFLISGGSNMLLTKDIDKLVVFINIKGISIDRENKNSVHLTVNAGENWHEFVLWCITQDYGGLENLSLIPGNVGTCPIQNIGAYGVEVKDTITKVEAIEIESGKRITFSNEECQFGYRNSIFKNDYDIKEAPNGESGIKKAIKYIPDIIISDIMMPKIDGIELCNTLKKDEKTSHIPIILLTAKASISSKLDGLKYGADDYLTKPLDKKLLIGCLQRLIKTNENAVPSQQNTNVG